MSATLDSYASRATLLDSRGRVELEPPFDRPGVLNAYMGGGDEARIPDHVKRSLDRASEVKGPFEPRNSLQTWEETLYAPLADGATTTTAAEVLVVPLFTLPANYLYPGRLLKWTVMGRQSTAITTPGTITLKLAYSATGLGAVVMAQSGAFAPDPTGAATNLCYMSEWWFQCRSVGTAGTGMAWGRIEWTDYDDATVATIVGNLGMRMACVAGAATPATAAIDTTVARALMPTHTESASTHSHTAHVAVLEALT